VTRDTGALRRYKVEELELAEGIPAVDGCTGYDALRLLVRLHRRPIGWVHVPTDLHDVVPAARITAEVRKRLGWNLVPLTLHVAASEPDEPATNPPISVVVCSRDRPELLARCLHALLAQTHPTHEIIVVDNAPSGDETRLLVERFPVRYVREDRPGLDWARNRGAEAASYDLIAYTDDDACADPGWLGAVASAFTDSTVAAVTGLVAPIELETPAQICFEDIYGGMGKGFTARYFHADALRPRAVIGVQALGVGANMAFRRRTLERVGGFDTALDVGTPARGGGDLDLFHRVLAAGLAIRYEPRALVWHRHRRSMAELKRQLAADGRSFGVYLLKILRRRTVARRSLVRYALWEWARWMVGRFVLGLIGRHRLPVPLLGAGLLGMVVSPWAYLRTHRSDRAIRRSAPVPN
jgi:GT2 family glycosyltransferase